MIKEYSEVIHTRVGDMQPETVIYCKEGEEIYGQKWTSLMLRK